MNYVSLWPLGDGLFIVQNVQVLRIVETVEIVEIVETVEIVEIVETVEVVEIVNSAHSSWLTAQGDKTPE